MKISKVIILAFFVAMISGTLHCQELSELKAKISATTISSEEDSLAYALAVLSYNSWARENMFPDPVIFAKAMIDGKNGNSLISEVAARNIIMSFVSEIKAKQAELNKAAYKEYIEENEAFLAKNREKPGITVTPTGLQYEVVRMGTGPKPVTSSIVKVHYKGTLIDGTEFDSSIKRNSPAQFPVSGVIPGWTEALQLMPAGSVFVLYIPEKLAYGDRGAGESIKPYSTLIFEVELIEIVK